jgi:HSP20 family molecular chaperone IbpA
MKRMYVTLGIILIALVWAVAALSQMGSSPDTAKSQGFDRMKRRMELREEMHRRIRDKLIHGRGDDQNMFKDLEQEFEETMSESFSGLPQFSQGSSQFQSEWLETKAGRTLAINPKDQNQKINIDVNASVITIKGESQEKSANGTFSSAFSNSFPVPDDCDGTRVKMNSKDGKLLVEIPFKALKQEVRKPLPASKGDVQI